MILATSCRLRADPQTRTAHFGLFYLPPYLPPNPIMKPSKLPDLARRPHNEMHISDRVVVWACAIAAAALVLILNSVFP
jgi:hypothetical protein